RALLFNIDQVVDSRHDEVMFVHSTRAILAGAPTTVVRSGTLRVTTAPSPTIAHSPMVTLGRTSQNLKAPKRLLIIQKADELARWSSQQRIGDDLRVPARPGDGHLSSWFSSLNAPSTAVSEQHKARGVQLYLSPLAGYGMRTSQD